MIKNNIILNNTEVLIYDREPTLEKIDEFTTGIVIDHEVHEYDEVSYFHRNSSEEVWYTVLKDDKTYKCHENNLLTKEEYIRWINTRIENNLEKINNLGNENLKLKEKLKLVEIDKPKLLKK